MADPHLADKIRDAEKHLIEEVHQVESTEGGMPQLDPSSFSSQLFWLVIVFAFLYAFMASAIIPRIRTVLGKRQHQIQHDLDAAEKAKNEATAARKDYESELANAKTKASTMIQQTQKEIDQFIASEQQKLGVTLEALLSESEDNLSKQRASARKEIEPMIASLTAQITKSITGIEPTDADVSQAIANVEGGK